MSTDLYSRPRPDRARDRRRILFLLCALTVGSFLWTHLRFPLQLLLASSNVGNSDRNDLIFDVFKTIDSSTAADATASLSYSSRSRDGHALFAVNDHRLSTTAQDVARHRLFDPTFAPQGTLFTAAQFRSITADRDNDGIPEFAMMGYSIVNPPRFIWFVLRHRPTARELIGLAQIPFQQTGTSHIGATWTAHPPDMPEWTFIRYTVPGGTNPVTTEKVCSFKWTKVGGVLRMTGECANVLDCMPGDEPISLEENAQIDQLINGLVADAVRKERPPPGSQPTTASQTSTVGTPPP